MLNQAVRYYPILDILGDASKGMLLEVGSGSEGIGKFVSTRFVGCDVDFPLPPGPQMLPVRGSAVALPFANGAFEAVVASDVIEHLEPQVRIAAMRELLRVTRCVCVVGFPRGKWASFAEKALVSWYRMLGAAPPPWLEEHLRIGLPSLREQGEMFGAAGGAVRVEGNENVLCHLVLMVAESINPVGGALARFASRHPRAVRNILALTRFGPFYRTIAVIRK